jgi:D-amino-acid dehydrogenase
MLPKVNWDNEMHQWACLPPSTPDGLPRLGTSPYANLFLNTGHGTLGWTQAPASAAIVADVMENKIPEISLDGLVL